MPPQTPPQTQYQAPVPVNESHAARNMAILFCVLFFLALGAGAALGYYQYQQVSAVKAELEQANANLASSTQKSAQLELRVAELTCKGVLTGTTCQAIAVPVSIKAEPARGASPLSVTFVVKVPNNNYTVDFGDGSTSWLSQGLNGQTAGECIPTENDLCIINIKHTYTPSNAGGSFVAKLMQSGTVMATTSVTVING